MQTLKLQLKIIITVILCGILFVSNFTVIKAENKLTNIYLMGDSTVSSRDNDYINGWGNHLYRYFDKNQKIEKLETISQYEDAVRYMLTSQKLSYSIGFLILPIGDFPYKINVFSTFFLQMC